MKKINKTTLNIVVNLLSLATTFLISFFLTPYITEHVGMEAYGIIGLTNNFTSYVTIITAALNSMASRFIIIEHHKGNFSEANKYFNSALMANTGFALITVFASVGVAMHLEDLINVSDSLLPDARITFFLVFLSFAISLALSVFAVGYYATNQLYVGAWRTVQSEFIRVGLLILIFNFLGVKIQYTVVATLLSGLVAQIRAIRFLLQNIPDLNISFREFELKKIVRMISSGIWNSISKLGQVLLNGLDLLITNLYIGGSILGSVSVAKTFSSIIITLISSVSDAFLPRFLKAYSKDTESLNNEFQKSTQVLGFFSCLIISMFFVYSESFYSIWLPGENAILLRNLSCLSLLSVAVSGSVYSMFSIYTVINKVRPQALSNLIMSTLSTATVFALLKFTDLGVYAIVGTSSVYGVIKNLTYNMYCLRKYAHLDMKMCYFIILRNVFTILMIVVIHSLFKPWLTVGGFFELGTKILLSMVFSCILYFIVALNRSAQKEFFQMIRNTLCHITK